MFYDEPEYGEYLADFYDQADWEASPAGRDYQPDDVTDQVADAVQEWDTELSYRRFATWDALMAAMEVRDGN